MERFRFLFENSGVFGSRTIAGVFLRDFNLALP